MKTHLHQILSVAALLLAVNMPLSSKAQCLCEGGAAPDSVVQTRYYDSITAITSSITFDRFDPTIGILACAQLSSYVTTILNFDLMNKEGYEEVYELESFRRSRFTGPYGLSNNSVSPTVSYGPYTLGPLDPMGTADEVHVGPDTVFNNQYAVNNFSAGGNYIGTGTVSFDYLNTSTTSLIDGSSNHDLVVRGYTRMSARLVYYWCPSVVLSSNIKNFAAVKNNKNIDLTWIVNNNLISSTYEIQVSKNGRDFTGIGNAQTSIATSGPNAKYAYQYNPNQVVTGQLFFRIRHTDAAGKVSYSPVKALNMDTPAANAFTTFPNPAVDKVTLQFDALLNGDYTVDITNQAGQTIVSRGLKLKNSSLINLSLGSNRASGVYYVRVKNASNGQIFSNKILINR
ncbi:MAG: T9SS type A sorting domain-containing protein [Chitinophagaceae bacterium]|nr:MAG: T9SS type A sorting domain-containing protein [Chitinophagaceae bacterium]